MGSCISKPLKVPRDLLLVGNDDAQVVLDDLLGRREAGLGGGPHAVELAAKIHIELGALVVGLLHLGELVVRLAQIGVVAHALELQGAKTILGRLLATPIRSEWC